MATKHTPPSDPDGQLDPGLLLQALTAVKHGDFSARLPLEWTGISGKIATTFNEGVERKQQFTHEIERVTRLVGKEGKINHRMDLGRIDGGWSEQVENINFLVTNLITSTREMTRVIDAVAKGDLTQAVRLELEGSPLRGEFLRAGKTINTMVNQLGAFSSEVTRVAREVGTEGKLGGQARVKGVSGTWKDLTDNVNGMATNLTTQVRAIATVTTAVAQGDLGKKITVEAMGEVQELKQTINTMVDQLGAFSSEVTRVAGEVGTEGKLGGQAAVKGASGTWKDLTDNVNGMATNLTTQVEMLHIVCHDVANHFTVINAALYVIASGSEMELQSCLPRMAAATRNGIALTTLVQVMQETEEKGLPLQPVALGSTVAESILIMEGRIQDKELQVLSNVPEVNVEADICALTNSVIGNILSNAIKFSHQGGLIEINALEEDDMVCITIQDHGIGMPDKTLTHLFDVTKSHSRPGTAGEKGTGFGMPLMRKFVTMFGGTVDVETREAENHPEDHGTAFIIRLKKVG
jgi:HAMP domain-containing protein/anti-sigma regulatory factor (Ser/Thr protein kinase)